MWEIIEQNKRKSIFITFLLLMLFVIFSFCAGLLIYCDIIFGIISSLIGLLIYLILLYKTQKNPTKIIDNNTIIEYIPIKDKTLYNIVEEMTIASGLSKMPKIYILDSDILNAFACGINIDNACIVISKGLIETLTREELQGVVAHEIAHIVNRDISYLIYAGLIVTIILSVSKAFKDAFFNSNSRRCSIRTSSKSSGNILLIIAIIVVFIIAPILSYLFYMCLSRKREYLADACAAKYTRYPQGLANALNKISNNIKHKNKKEYKYSEETIYNSNAFLNASFIVPIKENLEKDGLFSTHPNTFNRIQILYSMTSADYFEYNKMYSKITKKENIIPLNELKNSKKISNIIFEDNISDIFPNTINLVNNSLKENNSNTIIQEKQETKQVFEEKIKKHRQTEDLMWQLSGYAIIECDCETKLKIPSCYKNKEIICPHCNKKHIIN